MTVTDVSVFTFGRGNVSIMLGKMATVGLTIKIPQPLESSLIMLFKSNIESTIGERKYNIYVEQLW